MNSVLRNTEIGDYQFEIDRPNGGRVSCISSSANSIIILDRSQASAVPDRAELLDSFLDSFEQDPAISPHLPTVRKEFATAIEQHKGATLKTLRLRAGLSQAELASSVGTSQAAISEYESRRRKPGEDVIRGLSSALVVDFNTLMDALGND